MDAKNCRLSRIEQEQRDMATHEPMSESLCRETLSPVSERVKPWLVSQVMAF